MKRTEEDASGQGTKEAGEERVAIEGTGKILDEKVQRESKAMLFNMYE